MRKVLTLIILNLVLITFQDSFLIEFFGSAATPNFVLSLSFAFLVLYKEELAPLCALIGGLLLDILGVGIIGLTSASFVSFVFIAKFFKGLAAQVFVLVVATFLYKLEISVEVAYGALLNVILMFAFVVLIKKVSRKFLSTTYRIRS